MKKRKRTKKWVRITHTPEYFIQHFKNGWEVLNAEGMVMGVYHSEDVAKSAAVNLARRFLKVPRDYIEKYEHKLAGYEFLYKDMMGIKYDD